jgi:hypothetical protein
VDSFQHTLDHDTNKYDQFNLEKNMDACIVNNLTKLVDEYCVDKKMNDDEDENDSEEDPRKQSLIRIEKIMKQYYMLMESLEFRMERHEQLTKLTQKSIKITLIDQENGKMTVKK